MMVTLITPLIFKDYDTKSRLYQYKYEDYMNQKNIKLDLKNSSLQKRNSNGWIYPDEIQDRLKNLELNWVSYEDLFDSLPDTNLKFALIEFEKKYNQSKYLR